MVRRREVDLVIVAKLDRLTRSVKDLADLLDLFQRRGVSFISAAEALDTGSASGRLVINITVSVSQWERETIGERTATALRHKRAQRRVYNHEPYGYARSGDELIAVEAEQAAIGLMREWRACGWTFRRIARELDAAGTPTKSGAGLWHPQTIKDIVETGLHSSEAAA
jgi:DNA invertase Pin-like site-specific DNA recombinase